MTRFTKLKMLFEAMKKFVADDEVESEKLSKCVERADYILRRMNHARLKKEQEALLKQIKANLEIQIPNDDKSINIQHLLVKLKISIDLHCLCASFVFRNVSKSRIIVYYTQAH